MGAGREDFGVKTPDTRDCLAYVVEEIIYRFLKLYGIILTSKRRRML